MRNLLALIGLAVVVFGLVGWYCGWYKLTVGRAADGTLQIQTDVNTKKVSDDSAAFFEKVGRVIGDRAEKAGPPASTPGTTPAPPADPKRFDGGWLVPPKADGNR